ncbi:hypothetical protein F6R98_17775 [Candidatus Methylospira mobilis]|uniref:Uncharacterized protein n=1 Tax=Candidatus Methylospira mobilis TaxID=1808979 RepID=A0A5Q0BK38_9GAMM|nr:hypothetical protein [Candidatus Methylospira mobilis]QFY44255.1 hypothetical protein F6R98_17775 [Candidatus Methylospira mobilis]WNV06315.1 hypothetical protein RP726_07890 [Candidatus Methylospira mobilis]
MHAHLQLVRDFHEQAGVKQPGYQQTAHLADMDIIMHQSLLMGGGCETFKAIVAGDATKNLAGLVNLAYHALAAIACRGDDLAAASVVWRHEGSVLSVMRELSGKIDDCSSGESIHYSALYHLCDSVVCGFLNADFDRAFRIVHQSLMEYAIKRAAQSYGRRIAQESLPVAPDLNEAFYE